MKFGREGGSSEELIKEADEINPRGSGQCNTTTTPGYSYRGIIEKAWRFLTLDVLDWFKTMLRYEYSTDSGIPGQATSPNPY